MRPSLLLLFSFLLAACGTAPGETPTTNQPTPAPQTASPATPIPSTAPTTPTTTDLQSLVEKLRPLQQPKKPPAPNDWLAKYKEPGQSFAEFLKARPKPQVTPDKTLYVQPLGDFTADQKKLVADTVEFLSLFYSVKVKTLEPWPLTVIPKDQQRDHPKWGMHQIKTGAVMKLLAEKQPKDAACTIALTSSDLYPDDNWNFVFGEASLSDHVGVWSLYRYGDPATDYTTVLRRMLKVATHETGHMFGLLHCTAYECGMNGSNHLDEADSQPLYFCAECDPKILFATSADPAQRYATLITFAKSHKLDAEAAYWEKANAALEK